MDQPGIRIAPLGREHLHQICRLERICFCSPWSPESFRQEVARMRHGGASRVILEGARVRAYSVAWFLAGEGHLGNLAVSPRHRGRGFARALMEDLVGEAELRHVDSIWLEVRTGNTRAIRLYELFGFEAVTIRRNYYTQEQEDALVMVRHVRRDCRRDACALSEHDRPGRRPEDG